MTLDLVLGRVDSLSICFAYVFVVMAFLGTVYALHVKEDGQHAAAPYTGGTLGVTLAGDFCLGSAWPYLPSFSSGTGKRADRRSPQEFRYLLIHLFGGALLLAGIVVEVGGTGSLAFGRLQTGTATSTLMLLGFMINGAVPPFHAWLRTPLPRGHGYRKRAPLRIHHQERRVCAARIPGSIGLGIAMALYGIVYAMIENDIRRLLSYHIISQLGYMVCGVGLGTGLSMNGAAAPRIQRHFCKSLLFMATGAVLYATGKSKMTDLQGRVSTGLYTLHLFSGLFQFQRYPSLTAS